MATQVDTGAQPHKHVANKDQLLDGMVDIVVGEIDSPHGGTDWKTAIRRRVLSWQLRSGAPSSQSDRDALNGTWWNDRENDRPTAGGPHERVQRC